MLEAIRAARCHSVRVYGMMRLCVLMRMPTTIAPLVEPIAMVLTKAQLPD